MPLSGKRAFLGARNFSGMFPAAKGYRAVAVQRNMPMETAAAEPMIPVFSTERNRYSNPIHYGVLSSDDPLLFSRR